YVVAVRLELLVWHRATANDLDIGLRLGDVVENDWILDRNDGPAGDAHRQELVQIVDECPMTPAIWRHLDRGARATVAPVLRPAVLHRRAVHAPAGHVRAARRHAGRVHGHS